jgi:hypothetical protein
MENGFSSIHNLSRCLPPSTRCDSKINVANLIFTIVLYFVRTESPLPLRTEMYEYKQNSVRYTSNFKGVTLQFHLSV